MNRTRLSWLSVFLWVVLLTAPNLLGASEKIRIVTTSSTLASIVREVVGETGEIHFVAPPRSNIHFVTPTPKDVLKVKKAKVFVHGGLDLELWRDPLLEAAGNPAFLGKGRASIDVSRGVSLLEVPTTTLSRAEGDIHLFGNPHFWLDPANAPKIAENIAEGMGQIFPEEAKRFHKNASGFAQKIENKLKEWDERMAPHQGTPVISYHRSWPYFAKRFGLEIVGELEPKPGIPPTARHLAELKRIAREKGVKIVIRESYKESRTPKKLAEETGARVVTLAQQVGENKESKDYISTIEDNLRLLEEAL